ncbi:MAG: YHS domain-containing protein [Chloroflexi bacterium]|nr:YHS domain-containing protein [Chloroflexota bacterium]
MLDAGSVLPPPEALKDHVYERYVAPPNADFVPFAEEASATSGSDGLERLDPVCLMDVDPATTRHKIEFEGRTIAFCAPSCKKLFLADPQAYLAA